MKWYLKAADQGMVESQFNLANCYQDEAKRLAGETAAELAKKFKLEDKSGLLMINSAVELCGGGVIGD